MYVNVFIAQCQQTDKQTNTTDSISHIIKQLQGSVYKECSYIYIVTVNGVKNKVDPSLSPLFY